MLLAHLAVISNFVVGVMKNVLDCGADMKEYGSITVRCLLRTAFCLEGGNFSHGCFAYGAFLLFEY